MVNALLKTYLGFIAITFFSIVKVERSNCSGVVLSEAVFLKVEVERSC